VSELKEKFEQRAEPVRAIFDQFVRKLDTANELAASKPSTYLEFSNHPARLDYSYVRGIAAQLPALIDEAVLATVTVTTTNKELMDSGVDALITAPAGFGKTSFCRWNVLNDLRNLKEENSSVIPVLIPLHQVVVDTSTTAESLFFSGASLAEMWSKRRSSDGEKVTRRFRVYLDGLDEVPDVRKQRAILGFARDLKELEPSTHIVLTGREHVAGSHLNMMSRLHMAEMNDGQINELFDQWFSDSTDRKDAFKYQLESVPSIKQVIRVPLLATLVLSVYESTSTLPESRIRLYDMFIALMAGGWDVAKRVHRETQFGPQPKTTVLQYLAGRLHLNESREASRSQFKSAVRTLLPALESRSDALLEEIVHDGLLVPVASGYAFSHLSFQEYLAAKDLMEPKGKKASEALGRYLSGNQWWKEVLSFYVALSGQPKEMELFIRAEALKSARKSLDGQILHKTIGLLKEIAVAYPGAKPDLEFPEWPSAVVKFFQPPLPSTVPQ
jgi:predicted NACHT family NTPase